MRVQLKDLDDGRRHDFEDIESFEVAHGNVVHLETKKGNELTYKNVAVKSGESDA